MSWEKFFLASVTCFPSSWEQEHCIRDLVWSCNVRFLKTLFWYIKTKSDIFCAPPYSSMYVTYKKKTFMWEFYGWHLWMHGIAYLAKAPSATRAAAASHGTTPTRESICTSSSCKRTWIVPWIFHSPDFLTRSQSEVAIMMLHCLSKSFEPLLYLKIRL